MQITAGVVVDGHWHGCRSGQGWLRTETGIVVDGDWHDCGQGLGWLGWTLAWLRTGAGLVVERVVGKCQ